MAEIIQVKNRKNSDVGLTLELKKSIQSHREAGEHLIMATIIGRKGSAPRGVGTKMLIKRDGTAVGTIGGGCAEAEVMNIGRRMLQLEEKQIRIFTVDMQGSGLPEDEGMVCGGVIDVMLEYIE